jgi:pyruvate/2-oxoglutarate dehydrogenase complex dihydrolipoamide acyltransferase (E2) component
VSQSPKILAEVRTPHETVNDDIVIVTAWRVEDGSAVRSQDVIADIETSKAILEVEAEVDGFLEIIHPVGAEVAVGELIGNIVSEFVAGQPSAAAASAAASTKASSASGVSISKKAQVLVDEHGIDAEVFAGQGLVREVDVIKYLETQVEAKQAAQESSAPEPAATSASEPAAAASGGDVRLMLEEFAFTGTTATVTSSTLGKISLKMPAIRMQNIGDKETGLTPQQLANRMVKTLFKQVEASVGKSLKKMAKKAGQDALEGNLSEDAKGKLDGLKSLFKKKT